VNKLPPRQELPDDIDEHYRRISAIDPSRPSEGVARAVLAHAAQLAAERTAKSGPTKINSAHVVTNRRWRRPALFGTLAAAALAGLLLMPHLFAPRVLPTAVVPPAQNAESVAEQSVIPAPVTQQSQDAIINETLSLPPPAARRSTAMRSTKAIGGSRSEMAAEPAVVAENATPPIEAFPPAEARRTPQDDSAVAGVSAATMQSLRDEHVGIDTRDASGRTALMLAILDGQLDAVEALLKHGADPNATDAHGTTPLQAAISGNRQAIIAALKRAGAR
jgi:hypothetical protein